MNTLEFIKLANNKRLTNKNEWVFLNEIVNNKPIQYKAFDTWVQVLRYNNIQDSSSMNMNISDFKNYINNHLKGV
tara:strand:+ start:413 stop:637 length:225 start_codon:yes stop_codon:yes gene_type:complete